MAVSSRGLRRAGEGLHVSGRICAGHCERRPYGCHAESSQGVALGRQGSRHPATSAPAAWTASIATWAVISHEPSGTGGTSRPGSEPRQRAHRWSGFPSVSIVDGYGDAAGERRDGAGPRLVREPPSSNRPTVAGRYHRRTHAASAADTTPPARSKPVTGSTSSSTSAYPQRPARRYPAARCPATRSRQRTPTRLSGAGSRSVQPISVGRAIGRAASSTATGRSRRRSSGWPSPRAG